MNPNLYADEAARIAERASTLALNLRQTVAASGIEQHAAAVEPFIFLLAVFLLACFVGYYVVWNVTPALHSPLMGVTNAISSVIVVGAMLATGLADSAWAIFFGFLGVLLASVNIFGGFTVTQRMLSMFQAKSGAKSGAAAGSTGAASTGAAGTAPGWSQRMLSMFGAKSGAEAGSTGAAGTTGGWSLFKAKSGAKAGGSK